MTNIYTCNSCKNIATHISNCGPADHCAFCYRHIRKYVQLVNDGYLCLTLLKDDCSKGGFIISNIKCLKDISKMLSRGSSARAMVGAEINKLIFKLRIMRNNTHKLRMNIKNKYNMVWKYLPMDVDGNELVDGDKIGDKKYVRFNSKNEYNI